MENERTYLNVKFDHNYFGGLTIGYDFVDRGLWGRGWPSWMRYVGLALDATYENVHFRAQAVNVSVEHAFGNVPPHYERGLSPSGDITMFHISPMIIGKNRFLATEEIPSGRLEPYFGFGLGLVISNLTVDNMETQEKNKLDLSLLGEGGMRFMLSSNLSLDAAVRYRIIPTQFGTTCNYVGEDKQVNIDIRNPQFFNFLLRLSYHF